MWIDDDDDEDVTTTSNSSKTGSSPEEVIPAVIYKTERPFLKIGLWFSGIFVATCVILFAVGFIMGLAGLRPPTVDGDAIQNQWDKVTGQEQTTEPPSELDKVEDEEEK